MSFTCEARAAAWPTVCATPRKAFCRFGNRARLEESLFAFAATVSEIPITEQGLRGLSQIAKELAEDLDGIHKEYVRQSDEQR